MKQNSMYRHNYYHKHEYNSHQQIWYRHQNANSGNTADQYKQYQQPVRWLDGHA